MSLTYKTPTSFLTNEYFKTIINEGESIYLFTIQHSPFIHLGTYITSSIKNHKHFSMKILSDHTVGPIYKSISNCVHTNYFILIIVTQTVLQYTKKIRSEQQSNTLDETIE